MTPAKRAFDLSLAVVLAVLLAVPGLLIAAWLWARGGGPVFHVAERMAAPDRPFRLWKFRTMMPAGVADQGVSGDDKAARITPEGRFLRRARLDELPQLWNILRGDMSFVGPRPPLRAYVERFPDLYAAVLRSRPGLTGLATLVFHRHEGRILARCRTAAETDAVYARRCVPRKARLDLLYQRRASVWLDVYILVQTGLRVMGLARGGVRRQGARIGRMPRHLMLVLSRRMSRRAKQLVLWGIDIISAPVALYLAGAVVHAAPWPDPALLRHGEIFGLIALVTAGISLALGLPRIKLQTYESLGTTGLLPMAALVTLALAIMTRGLDLQFPLAGLVAFSLILHLGALAARLSLLLLLRWALRSGQPQTRVLIYGAGPTGQQLASALRSHAGIAVYGFVDDDPSLARQRLGGLPIHAPDRLAHVVRSYDIARVILAMPDLSAPKRAQLGRRLRTLGLEVQVLPSFAQLVGTERLVDTLTALQPDRFLGRDPVVKGLPDPGESYGWRNVLVTGAGGSIGAELCRQVLACRPRRLVLFDLSEAALYQIDRELSDLNADGWTEVVPVLGSVTDPVTVERILRQHEVEIVLHAAAYKHVPLVEANPLPGLVNNVTGTRVLATACRQAGVGRFILISTDKAVRPANVMGASKRLAEMVVQDLARRSQTTRFAIVRFGNVLGSSGSVIPLFKDQIARGGPVTLTDEDVTRYFMTIEEACRLVLLAGALDAAAETADADVFVLDMGRPVRIRDLAEHLIQAAGYTLRDDVNPAGDIEIRVIGLRPGEKLHEELLIGDGLLPTPHPRILRAREAAPEPVAVAAMLQEIGRCAVTGSPEAARRLALGVVHAHDAGKGRVNAAGGI
ncbi:polysaccharide biosynthesis protein [Pseudogemmobacter blasticus]